MRAAFEKLAQKFNENLEKSEINNFGKILRRRVQKYAQLLKKL